MTTTVAWPVSSLVLRAVLSNHCATCVAKEMYKVYCHGLCRFTEYTNSILIVRVYVYDGYLSVSELDFPYW